MNSVIMLVNHYGYIIIFSALLLELIAFPLPGEVMMTYCGFLVYQHRLNWITCIIVTSAGAAAGITISYYIGTWLGEGVLKKYGSYIHMGPDRLEKTSVWFKAYGKNLLFFAFFIPGIRHVTGYFSGMTEISYKKFAVFAYSGALIWVTTFISLGKVLGPDWDKYHQSVKKYLVIGCLIIAFVLIIYYWFKSHQKAIYETVYNTLVKILELFHSMGRLRIAMASLSVVFLVFCALVIGVVQDYLANEFTQFDKIGAYLVRRLFSKNWVFCMKISESLTSVKALAAVTIIMIFWIMYKKINKLLEIRFLLTAIFGGEILQFILMHIFRRPGPSATALTFTFPGNSAIMSLAAYGFITYILIRHIKNNKIKPALIFITVIICVFSGISPVYFGTEYASDVYAGYIFGGIWMVLNIILMEINRILPS